MISTTAYRDCILVGKGLAASPLKISAVYSSPSLRCVETADYIVKCKAMYLS